MRIQDLKTVYICPDHNEKYHARKLHMDELLTSLGFKDFTHYKSGTEAYPKCLTDATVDILTQHLNEPVLILEDDIEFNGVDEFEFVPDVDAIYIGNSRSGGHPTSNIHFNECKFEPYSKTQVRVLNMLGGHAIIYISSAFKTAVINALTGSDTNHDILLSRIQSSFKVLANKKPSFFQSGLFNDGQYHIQGWTDFELVTPTLHLIATNKYISFLPEMTKSAYTHFFPKTQRHIVIYTNMPEPENHVRIGDVNGSTVVFHYIQIEHEPWPLITLKRFHRFSNCPLDSTHSFYCDVDAFFTKTLTTDMLNDSLYGTIHPGFKGGKGTVCSNHRSNAYIPFGANSTYFCGGFFGGDHNLFMKMACELRDRIQIDLNNGVMADWHDESHLNWYFWKNPPSIFTYPFAVAEPVEPTPNTYVVFIDKSVRGGHDIFRDTVPPPAPPAPIPRGLVRTAGRFRLTNLF